MKNRQILTIRTATVLAVQWLFWAVTTRRRAVFAGLLTLGVLSGCKEDKPTPQAASAATSISAHNHAAGETCFLCDPSKREPGRLWCEEHGHYEDRCWQCHPELRDPNRPYCAEHGLYEDECFVCNPRSDDAPSGSTPHADGANKAEMLCNEHRVPEHDCGICRPQRAATLPVGDSLLIRLASTRSADLAGISVARPVPTDASTSLSLLGEIRFDGNRLAKVSPLSGGVIARVHADVGQVVEAGQVLAMVHAPGVATARAAYLSAQAELQMRKAASDRQRGLFENNIGSRRAMEEAEAAHRRAQVATKLARQRLLNLGFRTSQVASVADARSDLPLRAPFRGTVVGRTAVQGEAVKSGTTLFEIVDLNKMWVELSVPEEQATRIGVDTRIQVGIRGQAGVVTTGRITWMAPLVDERTRMVRARGVVPNGEGLLRHGMFADVTAIIGRHPGALRLPASAISRVENLPYVFIRQESDLFAARRVDVGDRLPSGEVVVHRGIDASDAIVTVGGFVIKSAFLASRLGAGCVDD